MDVYMTACVNECVHVCSYSSELRVHPLARKGGGFVSSVGGLVEPPFMWSVYGPGECMCI